MFMGCFVLGNVISSCLNKIGYEKVNYIQKEAFKVIVKHGKSAIIIAPTGMGKTEAAVFPVMYEILKNRYKPISALYISPLRALNRDLEKRLRKIANCFRIRVALRHGDTSSSERKRINEEPPHLLITTPETLSYLLINEKLRKKLVNLRYVVIDEFRELVESKRGLLLFTMLHFLEEYVGRRIVKIALTATLSNVGGASKLLNDPLGVEIIKDTSSKEKRIGVVLPECKDPACRELLEDGLDPEQAARLLYIIEKIRAEKNVLIFTNTRSLAEKLGVLLNEIVDKLGLRLRVAVHHGSLSKKHRVEVEEGFRKGEINGLIATSSMELGIDIGRINYVIQYLSPRQAVRLEQRVGRSGHKLGGVSKGSIIVNTNPLQILESIILAHRALNGDLEKEIIMKKPFDVLAYSLAIYALMKGEVNIDEIYEILKKHELYKDLSIDELESVIQYLCYTRLVKCRNKNIYPSRRTRLYIYFHTMIPDTRDVVVIDVKTHKKIGSLTEEYVVLNINPNDTLVLAGKPWRVVEYNEVEAKLYVEPLEPGQELIVIPHWEGENIPVEYDTAQKAIDLIDEGINDTNIGKLRINDSTIRKLNEYRELLRKIRKDLIRVIYDKKHRIIYLTTPYGSRMNKFLRDFLKYILTTRYPGYKLYVYSTPYSIIILEENKLLDRQSAYFVRHVLEKLPGYINNTNIKIIAKASGTLQWRIYQVAQRFGAINIKDRTRITKSLLESYVDTIIGVEALREVKVKDYDLQHVFEIAGKIANGAIKVIDEVETNGELLKILIGYTEKQLPPSYQAIDEEKYIERIKNRKITLICIKCGYKVTRTVREILEYKDYRCPRCGSRSLAPVKGSGEKEYQVIKKYISGRKLSNDEKKILNDLRRRALLLLNFGSIIPLLFAATGVGTSEAIRILNELRRGSSLVEELYKSELRYVKIKKFLK